MKSFLKATRAGLVIMIALCMVMSFVTVVSAADAVIGNIVKTAPATEGGDYTVTVPVSGIEAGGDATILIHDTGEVIDKHTIKYVNQEPTTEGAYEFTAVLKKGNYTVKAGGTGGAIAAVKPLGLNTAPTFSVTTDTKEIPENSPAGTAVGTYTATDIDCDDITYSLSDDDATSFAINPATGAVITSETAAFDYESGKTEYSFTVLASDGELTSAVGVTVTVNVADVSTTITSYTLSSTEGTIVGNEAIPAMPTTLSYTIDGGSGTIDIKDWTWDKQPVAVENIYPAGEYIATPDIDLPAEFVVAQDVTLPTYTLTITEYSSTTEITGYQPVDALTGFTGTAEAGLGLPAKVTALYDGGSVECDVTWTCATYSDISLEEQTFTGNVTLPEGYEEASDVMAPVATVTLSQRAITADYHYIIKVTSDESYADDYYATLLGKINVSVEGYDDPQEITVTWPETAANFPPEEGETLEVDATFTDTDYIKGNGKRFYVIFETVDKNLAISVNGYNSSGVVVKAGQDATVTALYYDETAEFAFAVTAINDTPDGAELTYSATRSYSFGAEYAANTNKKVTVFVKVNNEVVATGSTIVFFSESLYYGSVYIDATAENPTYSAIRVNKNNGMTVTADYKRYDGAPVVGTYTAEIRYERKGEDSVLKATADFVDGKATFSSTNLADLNGSYRVYVILKDAEEEILHEFARTTNIQGFGVWYSSMKTNGISSNINVNKSKPLSQEIQFDETPNGEELYVDYDILTYGQTPIDKELSLRTTNGGYKFEGINVSEKANGAYSIFTLAKKTADQNFYDFNFGRTIYIRDSLSQTCNIRMNGSTSCSLAGSNELTVAPVGSNFNLDNVSYKYKFYKIDKGQERYLGEQITIGDKTEFESLDGNPILITSNAQSIFTDNANIVVLEVYVNGELDMTIDRIFYK